MIEYETQSLVLTHKVIDFVGLSVGQSGAPLLLIGVSLKAYEVGLVLFLLVHFRCILVYGSVGFVVSWCAV